MSETMKRNPAIACGDMKSVEGKIIVDQGKYGPSKMEINTLAGMEIKVEGYELTYDQKSGKVLRVKDNRTIGEVMNDRRRTKIIEAMKKQREGIEI